MCGFVRCVAHYTLEFGSLWFVMLYCEVVCGCSTYVDGAFVEVDLFRCV